MKSEPVSSLNVSNNENMTFGFSMVPLQEVFWGFPDSPFAYLNTLIDGAWRYSIIFVENLDL